MIQDTEGHQSYKKSTIIFVIITIFLAIIGVGFYFVVSPPGAEESTESLQNIVPGITSLSCQTTNDCATACGDDPCLIGSCNTTQGNCVCLSQC